MLPAAIADNRLVFRYRYAGLRIEANEQYPQLRAERDDSGEAKASVFLNVIEGSLPAPDRALFRWEGRYGLVLGMVGEHWLLTSRLGCAFLIDETHNAISCIVRDRGDPAWLDVLVRRILPRVAIRHGATALHAAAAAKNGRALVLLGQSGAGKSTTSAVLGTAGWDILSDDISVLWDFDSPKVAPATTGICVWADSHAALNLEAQRSTPLSGYFGKQRYALESEANTAPVSLKSVVLLDRSTQLGEIRLTPTSRIEALGHVMRQRIRFNPADLTGPEFHGTFAALSSVVQAVPCFRLSYPSDYGALPDVVEQLEEMLGGRDAIAPTA